ncbi:exosome complex exonuclease RRP42-like [Artemia franciscana]|uniref:Ribosomal RNA-processing protein 42 n=1 Tax=Artemia franciscana TaxID=6661 RepID=A0AA88LIQ0_ARTSF|nr:hypothetical protein QYM36_001801 [Artemia franciscana]
MSEVAICIPEKTFILHGVDDDLRNDGRSYLDYRPLAIETGILPQPNGSCRVRLATSDILVATKLELEQPDKNSSKEGKIEFFVDCSANATPEFEGRGGNEFGNLIAQHLSRAYGHPSVLDLETLCVVPEKYSWKIFVDILILQCGGNLFDAVSLAVKGALFNTEIPKISVTSVDGGEPELEVSDDPKNVWRLPSELFPCLVTLCMIGDNCIVDPTAEEEACSKVAFVFGVTENKRIVATRKMKGGSISPESLAKALEVAGNLGEVLNKALMDKLHREERKGGKRLGFLS